MTPWPDTFLLLCSPPWGLASSSLLLQVSDLFLLASFKEVRKSKLQKMDGRNSPHRSPSNAYKQLTLLGSLIPSLCMRGDICHHLWLMVPGKSLTVSYNFLEASLLFTYLECTWHNHFFKWGMILSWSLVTNGIW